MTEIGITDEVAASFARKVFGETGEGFLSFQDMARIADLIGLNGKPAIQDVHDFLFVWIMLTCTYYLLAFYLLKYPTFPRVADRVLAVALPFKVFGSLGTLLATMDFYSSLATVSWIAVVVGVAIFMLSVPAQLLFGPPTWLDPPIPSGNGGGGGIPVGAGGEPDSAEANDNDPADRLEKSWTRRSG